MIDKISGILVDTFFLVGWGGWCIYHHATYVIGMKLFGRIIWHQLELETRTFKKISHFMSFYVQLTRMSDQFTKMEWWAVKLWYCYTRISFQVHKESQLAQFPIFLHPKSQHNRGSMFPFPIIEAAHAELMTDNQTQ